MYSYPLLFIEENEIWHTKEIVLCVADSINTAQDVHNMMAWKSGTLSIVVNNARTLIQL